MLKTLHDVDIVTIEFRCWWRRIVIVELRKGKSSNPTLSLWILKKFLKCLRWRLDQDWRRIHTF
jgi:hypothetical protein